MSPARPVRMTPAQFSLLSGDPVLVDAATRRRIAGKAAKEAGDRWENTIHHLLDLGGWLWEQKPNPTWVATPGGRPGPGGKPAGRMHGIAKGVKGRPDIVATHPTRGLFVVAEAKVDGASLTSEQRAWVRSFEAAGITVQIWRPKDLTRITAYLLGRTVS